MSNLTAILLTGGKSSRMGQNKAHLTYRENTPEYLRLHKTLSELTDKVFLCHPADQDFALPFIEDPANGPLAAIHAALQKLPNTPLLIVACDLPLLEADTLQHLIQNRDPNAQATAYRSTTDNLPEPLCTIYEPSITPLIAEALAKNNHCPRSLLTESNTHLLDLPNPVALLNANTPADTLEIRAHLTNSRSPKSLNIRYFAQHREITGTDSETITTSSVTPSGLYEELKAIHKFPHKQKHLMLAINGDFAPWETLLTEGDEITYLPPAAGG